MSFMKKLLIPAVLLITASAYSQEKDRDLTRQVIIRTRDSIIYAGILLDKTPLKTGNDNTYYWYIPDYINFNRGGYSGQLLHGEYCLYDRNFNLIEKGIMEKGVKTGIWKRWNSGGSLLRVETWKNGQLAGTTLVYGPDGELTGEYRYRNGEPVEERQRLMTADRKKRGGAKPPVTITMQADSSLVSLPSDKPR